MSLILEFSEDRWQLRDPEQPKVHPVSVDFLASEFQRRLKEPKGSQLLFRAIGQATSVFDATAGLGSDSFLLASWGFKVTACERNEMIFQLLSDGVERLKLAAVNDPNLQKIFENINLINEDSLHALAKADVDVVYLDPMYPDLKGSALPKKEMQLLRKLFIGVDPERETSEVLEAALKAAKKRVVLKRPPAAPEIKKPSHSLEGKAVRFDIYKTG
jgi:16S rRNA (guanine1516-N2)-methyltransferase